MYRTKDIIVDKEKVFVSVKVEREIFSGTLSVGNQQRVLDLFNNRNSFFAIDVDGETIIINKSSVSWLRPVDQARMTMNANKKPRKCDLYLGCRPEEPVSTQDYLGQPAKGNIELQNP